MPSGRRLNGLGLQSQMLLHRLPSELHLEGKVMSIWEYKEARLKLRASLLYLNYIALDYAAYFMNTLSRHSSSR